MQLNIQVIEEQGNQTKQQPGERIKIISADRREFW